MESIITWMDQHQGLAAWVQAVFSIIAIAGAFLVSRRQTKTALLTVERSHHLAEKTKQRAILAIAQSSNIRAEAICKAFSDKQSDMDIRIALVNVYDKSIIDGMVSALSSVPMYDIGSSDGVIALQGLRDHIVFMSNAVDAFIKGPWRHPDLGPALEQYRGDNETVAKMTKAGTEVLSRNAQLQFECIRRNYESFVAAMCDPKKTA